jgi:4-hydroxythreonine-4-phosphate dehydrogenase
MLQNQKPTAVVIGDALGIGPEITVKALADPRIYRACQPLLIGDRKIIEKAIHRSRLALRVHPIGSVSDGTFRYPHLDVVDLAFPQLYSLPMGKLSKLSGEAFVQWFRKAMEMAERGEVGAIAYAPLNKEAVHAAGYPFHDELDMVKAFHPQPEPFLIVVSIAGRNRCATVPPLHASLLEACQQLNLEAVFRSILLFDEEIRRSGISRPRIAVAGLNPHAGESGLHGDEEVRIIGPAIEAARARGIDAQGPFPPDTVFVKAKEKKFDGVLGMYHDQTRIALKLLSFKKIIYTILGTPIPFVSVAHGTAYDIAGQGIADEGNFKLALRYAARVR